MIELVNMAFKGLAYLQVGFLVLVVVGAVWGAIQVAMTRDDAFTVIDRSKQNWLLLLGGTAVGVLVLGPFISFIWIAGAVIVGIYWQDIRPSIRDVLGNAQ
ncbi:MAG: DUF2516 family protein [Corynebacterium sp.]|uniref:DUF2516 family protein n=1 Tax=unclassified Corynebacterium TaxID=2624378 RepID=UPI002649BE8D|nr:DUF2516 family protein [Corynebacterium sp.]MDN5581185.1 DUF2516 family protein [Corynebacterium sp.]MDN5720294.1 DUF2516 family protein [Corynebacterium sp.]MDN6258773.1 DUF2516 family protein [Corynebacterium sp.]MDN6325465.1 DUF2516 family protein [Corynebacterium sp.]MDN6510430.1 DUF2516 family protein [Corynebacterium sp.]